MDELIEGKLQLKKDGVGWRHFIKDGEKDRDLYCGAYMKVQPDDSWPKGSFMELQLDDGWFEGCYTERAY